MSLQPWWQKFITLIYDRRVITLVSIETIPGVIVKPTGYKRRPIGYPRYISGSFVYNHNNDLLVKPIYKVEEVFHGQLIYHSEDGQKQRLLLNLAKPTKELVLTELQQSFTQGSQYVLKIYFGLFAWITHNTSRWYVTRR